MVEEYDQAVNYSNPDMRINAVADLGAYMVQILRDIHNDYGHRLDEERVHP